jgi:predicted amidophosphoribosyltransferase
MKKVIEICDRCGKEADKLHTSGLIFCGFCVSESKDYCPSCADEIISELKDIFKKEEGEKC